MSQGVCLVIDPRRGHASGVRVLLTLLTLGAIAGCQHRIQYPLVGQPGVVTLVGLHPNGTRPELWTMNYQEDGFLPVCTPVVIESVTAREMRFLVPSIGVRFHYRVDDALVEPFTTNLDRMFGTRCPSQVEQLSPIDRDGIGRGVALVGMSRIGVFFALGPPPAHATPSLDLPVWRYWRSRHSAFEVRFVGDVVSEVDH
jgi:hypothetical protein